MTIATIRTHTGRDFGDENDTAGRRNLWCDADDCRQLLAREGKRGDIYPVVVGVSTDDRGRLVIICPACGHRNRFLVRGVA